MGSLNDGIKELIEQLKTEDLPCTRASKLHVYVANALREKDISLYEAYLIEAESQTFVRMSYTQLASYFYHRLGISTLIELMNMKMMSILFQDEASAKMWHDWGLEAYQWIAEKRPHYILDEYLTFLNAENDPAYLTKLLEVRAKKRRSFNKGPYHDESFPYSYCSYEKMLLAGERLQEDKTISDPVAELLTEICLLD